MACSPGMDADSIPAQNLSQRLADDDRTEPPHVGGERETLVGFLDWYRATFEQKCAGVARARLSECSVPPSGLSLHGLVRHLAGVERWWFQIRFAGADVPRLYYSDDDPNQNFDSLDGDVEQAFAVWRRECERSREIVAAAPSLDATGRLLRDGAPFSLRWLLVDLVGEYARHCGHADLLRERIDGAVGY